MNRRSILSISAMTVAGLALLASDAVSQQKSLKEQLVGTWNVVSVSVERKDGSKFDPWGGKVRGFIIFAPDGRFVLVNTRSDRPKFASGNRMEGTPDENKAVVQGSLAYIGTYTVNEAAKTYTLAIEVSTFPNDEGTKSTRPFTVAGDELKFTNPAGTIGGAPAQVTLRRAK